MQSHSSPFSLLLTCLPLSLAAACGSPAPGEGVDGHVAFAVGGCGPVACDLAHDIVASSSLWLELVSLDGTSLDGLAITTSDFDVATAFPITSGGNPGAELITWRAGELDLRAVAVGGAIVDRAPIAVVEADRLDVAITGAGVVGPLPLADHDALFEVPADQDVVVTITALADGETLIGEPFYDRTATPTLEDAFLTALGGDDSRSVTTLRVPAGTHELQLDLPGATTRVRIVAD